MDTRTGQPMAKRKSHMVTYGHVDGEARGVGLMNPPRTQDDPYFWLRDDERKNPEMISYLTQQNEYTEKVMEPVKDLEETLYKEYLSRVQQTSCSHPTPQGEGGFNSPYRYYHRTVEGKGHKIHCRVDTATGKETVLLDVNVVAEKYKEAGSHCHVTNVTVSHNHKILSYGVDTSGSEKYRIHLINLETGEEIPHKLPEVMYCDYGWVNDNQTIIYSMGNDVNRMYQAWMYNLTDQTNRLLYQEDDSLFSVHTDLSMDGSRLLINSSSFDTSECYYMDLTSDTRVLTLFHPRETGHKYNIDYHRGNWFIRTNTDGYANFKLMVAGSDHNRVSWSDFLADPSLFVKGYLCFKNYLVVQVRIKGTNSLRVFYYDSRKNVYTSVHQQEPFEQAGVVGLAGNMVYNTNNLWFTHESMVSPTGLYQMNMSTGATVKLWEEPVPNYDSSQYECKRLYAPSHDGVMVPISIVYKKGFDHSRPTYLYGYGSYGITIDPYLNTRAISLLDRGFAYAIAHVRGSSFIDYQWYLDGKMEKKMNSFLDFINCAEYLIETGFTTKGQLAIEGRSAGGLLMGAVMTMRPDLFHCVIAGVPFVDVITTMSDPSIPLTVPEWKQWGNPNTKKDYDLMIKYSPYDNLGSGEYPHCLFTGGLNDPRVGYWEPAKFIAKLNHLNPTSDRHHLLKIEMDHGHFGNTDRYRHFKERATEMAFVLQCFSGFK